MYATRRIESLVFVNQQSAQYIAETDTAQHYFANGELIYSDKIAKFVVKCETQSCKAVSARLGQIYTDLFIDEFQDLAGWDLDVIEMLLQSGIRVTLVGDPRQHIYTTNPSAKNKQHLGINVVNLVEAWERRGWCSSEHMSTTYRCNSAICDFANKLWPDMNAMTSLNDDTTGHDGVFLVSTDRVEQYIRQYKPQVLRYDKSANTYGFAALNFGAAKGLQFDRVLLVPTGPIKRYLADGDLKHVERSRDKLHVAITRARSSVAFVYDSASVIVPNRWQCLASN
jgi:DNA helicase-2/ATP-dependent DNA helicase PcrA